VGDDRIISSNKMITRLCSWHCFETLSRHGMHPRRPNIRQKSEARNREELATLASPAMAFANKVLTRARRTIHQNATRNPAAQALESAMGSRKKIHQSLPSSLASVYACNIRKGVFNLVFVIRRAFSYQMTSGRRLPPAPPCHLAALKNTKSAII